MIDWLNETEITFWARQEVKDKKLLILNDGNVKKLFYHIPFIAEKLKLALGVTICCPKDCIKLLEKTFEEYSNINVIPIDYSLVDILDDRSYDFIVSLGNMDYPYSYKPILASPMRSIYQEKIGNQIIDKLICGVALQNDFIHDNVTNALSKTDIYQLLYKLERHCHLYSYDYNDKKEYKDYCVGKVFFCPNDIIDLAASYISFSDIVIANDNLVASIAVAMGKYVIILAHDEYEQLLTINHPNVAIIDLQTNEKKIILEKIIDQFLIYQQRCLKGKLKYQQQITNKYQQANNDSKRMIVNYLVNKASFKDVITTLKSIPIQQRNEHEWYYLINSSNLVKDYQSVYDLLTQKSTFNDLTFDEQQKIFICVLYIGNHRDFTKYALAQYGGNFANIEYLNIKQLSLMLQISLIADNKEYTTYYCNYLLKHDHSQIDRLEAKKRLVNYYFNQNNFINAWLIYKKVNISEENLLGGLNLPYWQGENVKNIKLLIICHKGLGDIIFHLSMIYKSVKDNEYITLSGKFNPLISIIKRSFPKLIIINNDAFQHYDAIAYLNDMPRLLGITKAPQVSNVLKINNKKRNQYRKKLEQLAKEKKIIGISYYSRNHNTDIEKYCPLDFWQPILTMENVVFVNLQYGARAYDLDVKAKELNIDIIDWDKPDKSNEFDDFTALVGAMDVVVTISNTLTHQASAIGIPCYVMVSKNHHWYYASPDEKSLWYQSQIIMRQFDNEDDWQGVIERTKNHILENHF